MRLTVSKGAAGEGRFHSLCPPLSSPLLTSKTVNKGNHEDRGYEIQRHSGHILCPCPCEIQSPGEHPGRRAHSVDLSRPQMRDPSGPQNGRAVPRLHVAASTEGLFTPSRVPSHSGEITAHSVSALTRRFVKVVYFLVQKSHSQDDTQTDRETYNQPRACCKDSTEEAALAGGRALGLWGCPSGLTVCPDITPALPPYRSTFRPEGQHLPLCQIQRPPWPPDFAFPPPPSAGAVSPKQGELPGEWAWAPGRVMDEASVNPVTRRPHKLRKAAQAWGCLLLRDSEGDLFDL